MEVYYDGSCPMCTVFAETVSDSSQREKFEAQDITHGALPEGATAQDVWKEMYVVEDGKQYKGADAVLRIMSEYSKWHWLAWIGKLPVFNQLAHIIYRIVAANRHRIPWKRRPVEKTFK